MTRIALALFACGMTAGASAAQDLPPPKPGGSASFCLFEVPSDENGKRRFINLPIVQYVEASRSEVRIYYGGGNFGSGHEVRLSVNGPDQANAWLDRLQQAAAACAGERRIAPVPQP